MLGVLKRSRWCCAWKQHKCNNKKYNAEEISEIVVKKINNRIIKIKDVATVERIWQDVSNRKYYNNDGTLDTQYEITYNEYYQMISRIMYDGNGNFVYSSTYEYECPGFEQIYP